VNAVSKWEKMDLKALNDFERKFNDLTGARYSFDLMLELCVSPQSQVYFRIVDTAFLEL
jgi:hypothetical protein